MAVGCVVRRVFRHRRSLCMCSTRGGVAREGSTAAAEAGAATFPPPAAQQRTSPQSLLIPSRNIRELEISFSSMRIYKARRRQQGCTRTSRGLPCKNCGVYVQPPEQWTVRRQVRVGTLGQTGALVQCDQRGIEFGVLMWRRGLTSRLCEPQRLAL